MTTYRCSKCGAEKTDTVPALGHDWQVVAPAPVTSAAPESSASPETTNPPAQSATEYVCSRCGARYSSVDGVPPESGGGDTSEDNWFVRLLKSILGGIVKILNSVIGGVVSLLVQLIDDLVNGVVAIVDGLFSSFTKLASVGGAFKEFLGGVFSFLPPEIVALLSLSLSLSIVLMIVKFFKG